MTASPADSTALRMPAGFLWGVATAAHQNEGDNEHNQWAIWETQPGRISGGHRSGRSGGWRNIENAEADFDRAAGLGLTSLRLSVEWSRIELSEGEFDAGALGYYRQIMQLLLDRGIRPLVTLHHFTDPLWLSAQGGWENGAAGDHFVRFVRHVVGALGDQVNFWCTINEPAVYALQGYFMGLFPPGIRSMPRTLRVLRHMLMAHGRAYRAIHAIQNDARVGLAHNLQVFLPLNPASSADKCAAALMDQVINRSTLAACTSGRLTPLIGTGQIVPALIDACDYIGLNYYNTVHARFDATRPGELFTRREFAAGGEISDRTTLGEPYSVLDPPGLYRALKQVASYGKPIYITENGVPDRDDDLRPRYLVTHLAEAWRAVQEGVDLRGYYHWTLVDNFEWCEGWNLRFGLFGLDPLTGRRTTRTSAGVYQRMAQANGVPRSLLEKLSPDSVPLYFGP